MKKRIWLSPILLLIVLTVSLNAQWIQTNLPAGGPVGSFTVSGTNLFAGRTLGGVFLSTNNGASWSAVNTGLPSTFVNALAVSGTNLFAGMGGLGGVFLSTNNGASWSATGLTTGSMHVLLVAGTNVFAGASGGAFLSTNNGASWSSVNTGLTDTYVEALAVSGTNLFAGTYGGGVFLSTNNGTNWSLVNSGLTNMPVYALAVSGTNLFAGTGGVDGGVFHSNNNGASWSAVNTGLTNLKTYALEVSGNNLFAGTYGGGVYRRPLSEMVTGVDRLSVDLPTHFGLDQNYPNPFNPSTTITFSVPTKSSVSLKVFDALGRQVSVLVAEELPAGTYARQWNAADVPSGVYFYRLQAGEYVGTKKMMLLK